MEENLAPPYFPCILGITKYNILGISGAARFPPPPYLPWTRNPSSIPGFLGSGGRWRRSRGGFPVWWLPKRSGPTYIFSNCFAHYYRDLQKRTPDSWEPYNMCIPFNTPLNLNSFGFWRAIPCEQSSVPSADYLEGQGALLSRQNNWGYYVYDFYIMYMYDP